MIAGLSGYLLGLQSASDPAADRQPNSQSSIDQSIDLTRRYQAALSQANQVIDDMNDDVVTAQNIETIEELEAYVDAIPLRDTIAHPQP